MLKKIWIVMILCISLIAGSAYAEEVSQTNNDIDVYINNQQLKLSSSPIVENTKILLPLRDFLESIGTTIYWNNDTKQITAYKDNTFIKMKIDSKIAYKNGKSFNLKYAPTIINQKTYVPIDFYIDTFNMKLKIEDNNIYIESSDEEIDSYRKFDDFFYREIELEKENLKFSIPQYWDTVDKANNEYGFLDGYENVYLKLIMGDSDSKDSLDTLSNNFKKTLEKTYKENIQFSGSTTEDLNGIESKIIYYKIKQEKTTRFISYIIKSHNRSYIMNFSYWPTEDEIDSINTINNIMSTFTLSKITVDTALEHYVEYPEFLSNNFNITSEIYSNMESEGYIAFEGSTTNPLIDTLIVEISKDNNNYTQTIQVIDGKFKDKIYLPFGLGKHNLCIESTKLENDISKIIKSDKLSKEESSGNTNTSVPSKNVDSPKKNIVNNTSGIVEDELNTDTKIFDDVNRLEDSKVMASQLLSESKKVSKPIMKFSVLNLNPSKTIYLLPTSMIQNNYEEIYTLANGITSKDYNDSNRAKTIFNHIINNYEYKTNLKTEPSINTVKNKEGNSLSLNYLYASMLRAVDIPTKVVEGEILGNNSYWIEMKINGRWVTSDITKGILSKNISDISNSKPDENTSNSIEISAPEIQISTDPIKYLFVNETKNYIVRKILE